jgi:hypothetical protein
VAHRAHAQCRPLNERHGPCLFLLHNFFRQLSGETPLSPRRSTCGHSSFGLTNAASVHPGGLPRAMRQSSLATKLVGMTGYGPASFHDLLSDDDLLTEGSSVGDVSSLTCPMLRECAMADVQWPQVVPMETDDTHTPPDPRT